MAAITFVVTFLAVAWLCLYGAFDKLKRGRAEYNRPSIYPQEQWDTDRAADPDAFSDLHFYARRSTHPVMFWASVGVNFLLAGIALAAVAMVVFGGVPVEW